MTPDLKEFGAQVRIARLEKGWTLEETAHQILGNQDRKSYVSAVENGRKPKLAGLTIQKFAKALDIDKTLVERLIRTAPEQEEQRDRVEQLSDVMYDDTAALRAQHNIKESLAIALAYEYAEAAPTDYESAIAGLRRTLEVAAKDRAKGALPANTGAAVAHVIADVNEMNDQGRFHDAADALRREVEAAETREAEERLAREKLIEKGIAQAHLTRDADLAVEYLTLQINLDATDPYSRFAALIAESEKWRDRGRTQGTNFDLNVSLALAQQAQSLANGPRQISTAHISLGYAHAELGYRATDSEHLFAAITAFDQGIDLNKQKRHSADRSQCLHGKGNALSTLGERDNDLDVLHQAKTAFKSAIKICGDTHQLVAKAESQIGLGDVLRVLGQRTNDIPTLHDAVKTFRAVSKLFEKEMRWINWSDSQMGLGNAYTALGEIDPDLTAARNWIEQATAAYSAALKFQTQAKYPMGWARTQNNIGYAQKTLGERTGETAPLDAAKTAYQNALIEWTIDRVPMYWALTHLNLSRLATTYVDLTHDAAQLDEAQSKLTLARSVYDRTEATQYITECDAQQAIIDGHRAA